MKISQCMIVKNEEKNIRRALSWGKEIVEEQIVVDTGSTDRTIFIAKELGAKVYSFSWIDDFSAAKNFAIDKAQGEWIIFLDADEYFLQADVKKIPGILNSLNNKKFKKGNELIQINAIQTAWVQLNIKGEIISIPSQIRIFRNEPYIRYFGVIHENINTIPNSGFDLEVLNLINELSIYHTGYAWKDNQEKEQKGYRNKALIEKELERNPNSASLQLYMAETLVLIGETKQAILYAKEAILNKDASLKEENLLSAYQLIFFELYDLKMDNLEWPISINIEEFYEEAIKIDNIYPDFDMIMGFFACLDKHYEKAIYHLELALNKANHKEKMGYSRIAEFLYDIYRFLTFLYTNYQNLKKMVYYASMTLQINKFDEDILEIYLKSLLKLKTENSILDLLKTIYDFDNKKDLYFVLKKVKQIESNGLEELLKNYLSKEELERLYPKKKKLLINFPIKNEKIDLEFLNLFESILNTSEKNLVYIIKDNLEKLQATDLEKYNTIINNYNKKRYWGKINLEENEIGVIVDRAHQLSVYLSDFLWLYGKLSDFKSKQILFNIIENWISFNTKFLDNIISNRDFSYFNFEKFMCNEKEIFVDIGDNIENTYNSYIKSFGMDMYKYYYCYQINNKCLNRLKDKFQGKEKVIIKDEKKVLTLDQDISQSITFLNLNADGLERAILEGCKKHIRDSKPKLAIALYYNNKDLWEIPKIVKQINSEYKFYLRYYGNSIYPSEYYLLGI